MAQLIGKVSKYEFINTFNMTEDDKLKHDQCTKIYTWKCWLPEGVAPWDVVVYYNDAEELPAPYNQGKYHSDYVRKNRVLCKGYPQRIMQVVRQRLGLDEYDKSLDEEIMQLSKNEVFEHWCEWEGLINYASKLRNVVKDVYDITLE